MNRYDIAFLTKLTTGEIHQVVTSDTASFDEARASASIVLDESASLTFDQMYSVVSTSFWNVPTSQSINNYRISALDTSSAALQAAYVLSSSFLS
jgi:hypothetical protein